MEDSGRAATIVNTSRTSKEPTTEGITPEILAVIESAANSFLGKKVRIMSVRLALEPTERPTTWATQGRDIIHESHNLVQRGRRTG